MLTPLILSELDFLCNCNPLRGVPPCLTDILLVLPAALRLCLAIKLDLRGSPDSGSESEKLLSLEKYWQNFWWRHVRVTSTKIDCISTHISKDCESCLSVLYIFWQWNSTCEAHLTRGQNLKKTVHRNNRDWKNKNLTKECYWSPQQTYTYSYPEKTVHST